MNINFLEYIKYSRKCTFPNQTSSAPGQFSHSTVLLVEFLENG